MPRSKDTRFAINGNECYKERSNGESELVATYEGNVITYVSAEAKKSASGVVKAYKKAGLLAENYTHTVAEEQAPAIEDIQPSQNGHSRDNIPQPRPAPPASAPKMGPDGDKDLAFALWLLDNNLQEFKERYGYIGVVEHEDANLDPQKKIMVTRRKLPFTVNQAMTDGSRIDRTVDNPTAIANREPLRKGTAGKELYRLDKSAGLR